MIARAIDAVSAATGLKFINDGATSEPLLPDREPYQRSRYGDRWAPVLIGWGTADEVPDFGVDIAGEASTQKITRPDKSYVFVTGAIYLDAAEAARDAKRPRKDRWFQSVVEHELGHLVGLAHVNDSTQIMSPRARRGIDDYQAGDLTGLAALGRGACADDV